MGLGILISSADTKEERLKKRMKVRDIVDNIVALYCLLCALLVTYSSLLVEQCT